MKSLLFFQALTCTVVAATPLIVGVGSSYSYGPGVTKNIGQNLQTKLTAHYGGTMPDYTRLAVLGSHLNNITIYQAPQLKGLSPDLIFMLSGGNDLNYVTCLGYGQPKVPTFTAGECYPEPQSAWQQNFTDALDSIFQNVANPTKVILYIATYNVALGPATPCSTSDPYGYCPLSSDQVNNATKLYNDEVDFTVAALNDWRNKSSNAAFHTVLITMRANSKGHEVGSQTPWLNGHNATNGAAPWHPNDAGTAAIAGYIASNFTG